MTDMIRVSSTEFGKEGDRYQDMALAQPVIVTRNGRDRTAMISADEYMRLKRRDRRVLASGEVPDEIVEAIRTGKAAVYEARGVWNQPKPSLASRVAVPRHG